jgi:hypothetical protein
MAAERQKLLIIVQQIANIQQQQAHNDVAALNIIHHQKVSYMATGFSTAKM